MASIYYPSPAKVYGRVVGNSGLSEIYIDVVPGLIMVLTGSFPNTSSIVFIQGMDTGSTYPISSSWSLTTVSSSYSQMALNCITASYAANAAPTGLPVNNTSPHYKLRVSASMFVNQVTASNVLCVVSFTSSNARPDGGDIRVQWDDGSGNVSGSYFPITVGILSSTGSTMYNVAWCDTFYSTSVNKYVITYGDPNGNYMYFNQTQGAVLKKRGGLLGPYYVVYVDNSQADWWDKSQWGTIGVRMNSITGVDDGAAVTPTPSLYVYKGQTQVSFSVSTNGVFQANSTLLASNLRVASSPDQWGINPQDATLNFCDVCTAADGWFLQYDCRRAFNIVGGDYRATIRYRNGGKFVLSIWDTTPTFQSNFGTNAINGYIGGFNFSYIFPNVITGSNPNSAVAVVFEPYAQTNIYSNELGI